MAGNEPPWISIRPYSSTGGRGQKGPRIGWDARHRLKANDLGEGADIRERGFDK